MDRKTILTEQKAEASLIRKPGLEGKVLVGVIGPFNSGNRPSIKYVFDRLNRFSDNIAFVFVGDVNSTDIIQNERAVFVGHADNLLGFLRNLDCVLIPRFFKTGSVMGKMVYAMAAGLPVVTNNPENMEVINGLQAVIGQMEELPNLLNELVANQEKMRLIGRNAKLYVLKNHSLEKTKERISNLVDSALGAKS